MKGRATSHLHVPGRVAEIGCYRSMNLEPASSAVVLDLRTMADDDRNGDVLSVARRAGRVIEEAANNGVRVLVLSSESRRCLVVALSPNHNRLVGAVQSVAPMLRAAGYRVYGLHQAQYELPLEVEEAESSEQLEIDTTARPET